MGSIPGRSIHITCSASSQLSVGAERTSKTGRDHMRRIGVIVISLNADPAPLFGSIRSNRHDIRSYVFLHGQDVALKTELEVITASTDSRYFPYARNRGVARSWNEGLHASFNDGNDATFLVNDDLFFYEGGFDAFIDFVLS